MLPASDDILDILYQRAEFSRLVGLLKVINFAEAFQTDEIVTFFAPTNEVYFASFTTTINKPPDMTISASDTVIV